MKPPPFPYHAPATAAEACEILAADPEGSKVLAGGQSLVPLMNLRLAQVENLVDINRIDELSNLRVEANRVVIGAGVTQAEVERSSEVREKLPLLAEALAHVSHWQIRNRGTVVGSLCHADPAAELPAVWLALGGDIAAQSASGTRTLAPGEFFSSFLETALNPGELATEVRLDVANGATGASFKEVSRRHGDFALVGVATQVSLTDGAVSDTRIAVCGAGGTPVRVPAAEQLLHGASAPDVDDALLDHVAAEIGGALTPTDDIHASAEYRRHVAGVLARRALREALARASAAAGGS
jgi:aerobic carbon-monoxide dehydrogenase medium subunit